MSERALPADVPLERLVLGSVIVDSAKNAVVLDRMAPRDFAIDWHRTIFDRLQQMHKAHEPIDRVTVVHALQRNGELDRVGGIGYLTDLDNGTPRIPHLERYVELLQDKRQLRDYMTVFERLADHCAQGRSPHEVAQLAHESLARLEGPQQTRQELRSPARDDRNWFQRAWDWANTPLGSKAPVQEPERTTWEPAQYRQPTRDHVERTHDEDAKVRMNGREFEGMRRGDKLVTDRLPQLDRSR